jgi:hypothetical protein
LSYEVRNNLTTTTNGLVICGSVAMIEETTTKTIHFAYNNKICDTTNVVNVGDNHGGGFRTEMYGPRSNSKVYPKEGYSNFNHLPKADNAREIQISHHEFDSLKETTKYQIIFVYDRTMGPNTPPDRAALDSHSRICQALRFLGVGIFEYNKNSLTTPEALLANWVHEWNKLAFNWYEAEPETAKRLKEQASRRCWGLDELMAITAMWMQGKDEDRLLEPGRKLIKIDDENRLN